MYVLHYAPDNASLIVRLALEEMGAPYETRLVDRRERQQDSAAYRALNPSGLIPTLDTPLGPIFETGAILLWLSERHGAMAPSPGATDRGNFLKWLFFTSNTLHPDMRMLFYPHLFSGTDDTIAEFSGKTRERIARHLSLLDAMADGRAAWFSPDAPSVLTYYVCVLLRWLSLYPTDTAGRFDISAYPALQALAGAMETRPAALRSSLAEGLGDTIFTKPAYASPPEGSAT